MARNIYLVAPSDSLSGLGIRNTVEVQKLFRVDCLLLRRTVVFVLAITVPIRITNKNVTLLLQFLSTHFTNNMEISYHQRNCRKRIAFDKEAQSFEYV